MIVEQAARYERPAGRQRTLVGQTGQQDGETAVPPKAHLCVLGVYNLTAADMFHALQESAPISRLMKERIDALRVWAHQRCRFVDKPDNEQRMNWITTAKAGFFNTQGTKPRPTIASTPPWNEVT